MDFDAIDSQISELENRLTNAADGVKSAVAELRDAADDTTRSDEWRADQLSTLVPETEQAEHDALATAEEATWFTEETRDRLAARTASLTGFDLGDAPGLPGLYKDIWSGSTPQELSAHVRDALDANDRRSLYLHAIYGNVWLRQREEHGNLDGAPQVARLLEEVKQAIRPPEQVALEERLDRLSKHARQVRQQARRRETENRMNEGDFRPW